MDAMSKAKLIALIKKRKEYMDTPIEGDETLNYHAFEAFGTTIVLENYEGRHENSREFLIWRTSLRTATQLEDEILRAWDDEYPMLERDDVEFICEKSPQEGTVKR